MTTKLFSTVTSILWLSASLMLATPAQAQPSAAKNELILKILQIQRPAVETLAAMLAQQPAQQMMQQAGIALQTRVAADKREALAKDIQSDLKKYSDEVVPVVRERAVKLAPETIGKLLDDKFSEEELRDLIKVLESPVGRKFAQLNIDMQKALNEKLVAEMRPTVEPKVKALEASIAKRLGIQPAAVAAPISGAAPSMAPAKPAAK